MADLAIAIKIATEDQSSGPIGKIKGALGGLGDAVTAPTRALGGLVNGLGAVGLAAAGVGAAFDAVKGAGSLLGIGALNEMEQTRASFQAFTKDAGMTEKILEDVRKEAALTPFAFGEMAKATASLMPVAKSSGQGLMDLVKQAEILAASNPLQGLEGASFSLREAMTGDFTSIIERFNLSRQTINKLKEEGVPNMEIVRRAMQEMGFDSDLIAAKAETLDGRWSTFQDTLQTLQMKMGQPIFDAMKEGLVGLQGVLEGNMETFEGWADSVATGFTKVIDGLVLFGQLLSGEDVFTEGAEFLGDFLPPEAVDAVLNMVFNLGEAFRQVFGGDIIGAIDTATFILEDFGTFIVTMVEQWATDFAAWVDGADSGMQENLGELWTNMAAWLQASGFKIIETLARWGAAFIDWIGPKIPPMLVALGGFLSEIVGWMLGTGLPALLVKLGEWGAAFVAWVAPRIPPLLLALGELLVQLGGWLIGTALPAIILKLAEWADAFIKWVPGAAIRLLFELGKLEVQFLDWIASKVAGVGLAALDLGKGLVQGIQDGIAGALGAFWAWLQSNFIEKIPATIRDILNLSADTGALAMVGARMVEELKIGINNAWPSLEDLWSKLGERLAKMGGGGAVEAYVRLAAAKRGIDPETAVRVANTEGGVTQWNKMGSFDTGTSFGPFQLHYAGGPNPQSGLGDDFTALTGRHATQDPTGAIDFALDHAKKYGWGAWYGARKIGITGFEGIRGFADGGIAWQPQLAYLAEREPELIVPLSRVRTGGGGIDEARLAGAIVAGISATRPINLIGTSEELARKVRREQDAAARRQSLHRGVRRLR